MTAEERLTKILLQQNDALNQLYNRLIKELVHITARSITEVRPEELYKIAKDCNANEKKKVQALLDSYKIAVIAVMRQGIINSTTLAVNNQQIILASYTQMKGESVDNWRKATAKAFIESRMKRDGGLNLPDRVWNYTEQTKSEFEAAMSCVLEDGIKKGVDAETIGRRVRKYLNEPDMMYRRYHRKVLANDGTKIDIVEWRRRVVDESGKVHFVKEDLAKVGTGVYRSARQNGLRLAITETNMAYNYANCKRWSEEPFVLGIRIRLSGNHPEPDICDELQGEYPKDFMWRGWHPRCRCSQSAILIDRDSEEWKHLRSLPKDEYQKYVSPKAIKAFPSKFYKWLEQNEKKLLRAKDNNKMPYFVRDNIKAISNFLGWKENNSHASSTISKETIYPRTKEQILAAAKARQAARNDKQINDILLRFDERKYSSKQIENFRDIERNLGIKRGLSMDFEAANQGKGNVDYKTGETQYKVNCQSCVVAHELRMRGLDVTAQPNWKNGDAPNLLSKATWKCWKNADGRPMEEPQIFAYKFSKNGSLIGLPYKETIAQIDEHTKEVGRYHVSFTWKGEQYGHIVTMERKANGETLWYDPQTGERNFFNEEYAKKIKGVRAYRVDNLIFDVYNWNVVRPTNNKNFRKAKPTINNPKKRIKQGGINSSTKVTLTKEIIAYRKEAIEQILRSLVTPNLKDGVLKYSKSAIKRSIVHAKDFKEVDMFVYVINHTQELTFKRKSILGENKDLNSRIDSTNIAKKEKRGVLFYNEYELLKNDELWIVKTEVTKNKIEIPYNIYKKK